MPRPQSFRHPRLYVQGGYQPVLQGKIVLKDVIFDNVAGDLHVTAHLHDFLTKVGTGTISIGQKDTLVIIQTFNNYGIVGWQITLDSNLNAAPKNSQSIPSGARYYLYAGGANYSNVIRFIDNTGKQFQVGSPTLNIQRWDDNAYDMDYT